VGDVALRDYVLAKPVEGAWKNALAAQGHTVPDDDPKAEARIKLEAWIGAVRARSSIEY
jgi:hypothetical protein